MQHSGLAGSSSICVTQVLEQEDAAQQVQTGAAVSIQAAFRGLKGRRLAASHVAARLFQQVQVLLAIQNALTRVNLVKPIIRYLQQQQFACR